MDNTARSTQATHPSADGLTRAQMMKQKYGAQHKTVGFGAHKKITLYQLDSYISAKDGVRSLVEDSNTPAVLVHLHADKTKLAAVGHRGLIMGLFPEDSPDSVEWDQDDSTMWSTLFNHRGFDESFSSSLTISSSYSAPKVALETYKKLEETQQKLKATRELVRKAQTELRQVREELAQLQKDKSETQEDNLSMPNLTFYGASPPTHLVTDTDSSASSTASDADSPSSLCLLESLSLVDETDSFILRSNSFLPKGEQEISAIDVATQSSIGTESTVGSFLMTTFVTSTPTHTPTRYTV